MFTHHSQEQAGAQEPTSISLSGKHFHLCPTFEDLCQIEKKLSTSILALAKKLSDGVISLEELIVVLEHSVEAEARRIDLKAAVLEAGIAHVTQRLTALFVHLFRGVDAKAKPAGETAKEEPPKSPQ